MLFHCSKHKLSHSHISQNIFYPTRKNCYLLLVLVYQLQLSSSQ
nr:MAG TPA: hypothetical protein [Caudoviricetes sp.]